MPLAATPAAAAAAAAARAAAATAALARIHRRAKCARSAAVRARARCATAARTAANEHGHSWTRKAKQASRSTKIQRNGAQYDVVNVYKRARLNNRCYLPHNGCLGITALKRFSAKHHMHSALQSDPT